MFKKNGVAYSQEFDFTPIGQVIKKVREASGMTRKQLAEILDLAPRHIQFVENEGQYPSFQLFARKDIQGKFLA